MNSTTISIIAGLAFLVWLVFSYSTIHKILDIRRTPTYSVSDLPPQGQVEVFGTTGEKTLNSPVNNSACVLWQIKVEELKREPKGKSHWSTVCKLLSGDPFEISDDSGKIQILPEGADLILNDYDTSGSLNSVIEDKLKSLGISTTNWLGTEKQMRVSEWVIAPHEMVYEMGEVQQNYGSKSIHHGRDLLVISDRSESDLLSALYKDLGINAAVTLGVAVILSIYLAVKK